MQPLSQIYRPLFACLVLSWLTLLSGCGTTNIRSASEQLLMSDAVDRSVSQIDFRSLAGKKVFLDTKYLKPIKGVGVGFVNVDYIISSLRQQMIASQCLLQDTAGDAEYIAEVRVGALGSDGHEVTYGIPASNLLSSAASLMPNMPTVPAIPEIALAKKNDHQAAMKIAVFAYHRETKQPLWQSGVMQARSTAKDTWILGAGPFQSGTIYKGTQFAGSKLNLSPIESDEDEQLQNTNPVASHNREIFFGEPKVPEKAKTVELASLEESAKTEPEKAKQESVPQ